MESLRKVEKMISVIIPVYNSSKTIARAIDSVLNQIYKDIEIIVIDDESTDDTLSILKTYDNIRVFHIDHVGCVGAYVYGIKKAKGQYVMMLDSDDRYQMDYLEVMHNLIEYHKTDSVASAYVVKDNGKIKNMLNKLKSGNYSTSNINKICNKAFSNQFDVIPVRFNHIYKKDIIMKFIDELNPSVKQREDNIFNYLYLKNSKSIHIVNGLNSYIYNVNANSVTNNFNINHFQDFYYSVNYLYQLSNDYDSSQALLIDSLSICLSKAIDNKFMYDQIKDVLKLVGKSELLKFKPTNFKDYSFKEKIAIRLIINSKFKLLYNSYKILKKIKHG
jgi:glycosyltransferase involved in cell wall biosynthesis